MVSPLVALAIEPIDFGAQQGRLEATLGARQNRLMQPIQFNEQVRQFDRSAGQRDRGLDLTERGQDIQVDQFDRQLLFDRDRFEESKRQFGISSGLQARGLNLQERRLGLQEVETLANLSAAEREAAAERATALGNAAATLATFEDPATRFAAWQRLAPTLAAEGFDDLVASVQSPEQLTDDTLRTVIAGSSEALDQLEGAGLGPVSPTDAPVTSFDEFINASPEPLVLPTGQTVAPGGRVQIDRRNAEDAAFLRNNATVLEQAPQRQETGAPGDFSFANPVDDAPARIIAGIAGIEPGEIEARGGTVPGNAEELAQQAASVASFRASALDLQNLVRDNPQVTGVSGSVLSAANALRSEAEGFAQALGSDIDAPTSFEAYEDVFREVGIDNARVKSLVTDLAYAAALAREPGARLSTTDVAMSIRSIAGDASDPNAIIATVSDVADRLEQSFRFNFRNQTTGLEPRPAQEAIEIDLFGRRIQDLSPSQAGVAFDRMTDRQLLRLTAQQRQALRDKLQEGLEAGGGQ